MVRRGLSEMAFEMAKAQLSLSGSHLVIEVTEEGISFEVMTILSDSTMH
jgi:hypothetical protein